MPEDRFERLANLVTLLLDTERGVTYAEIVSTIPGYPTSEEARRRAFERDKKLLRDEDIPVVEENARYRIPPDEYYLPDLDLTDDQQLALQLAVTAVAVGGGEGGAALQKLMLGGGGGLSAAALPAGDIPPVLAGLDEHPLLPTLHSAIRRRATVTFTYGDATRTVEPALLFFRDRQWYLRGFDRLRDAERTFLIGHIEGDLQVGAAGEFEARESRPDKPTRTMPRENWLIGHEEPEVAIVWVDAAVSAKVVADAGSTAKVTRAADGSATIEMPVVDRARFRSWILGFLDHVEVKAPPDLRKSIVDWLATIAEAG